MTEPTTTRRSVLKRAFALAAGAAGAATVANTSAAAGLPDITMRLVAHHVDVRGGEGQRHAALADDSGATVGHLAGTQMPLQSPFGLPAAASSIELHTLSLDGGTLLAQGAFDGSEGTFFVVGGTGRFGGARGSYGFRLGHGAAVLTLTIVTGEGS